MTPRGMDLGASQPKLLLVDDEPALADFVAKTAEMSGFQPIVTNITDTARRHGNDERIFLRDFLNGVSLLSEVVEEYARFPPAPAAR